MEEILFGKRLIRIKWHLPKYIVLNSFLIFSAWQPFNEMTFEHTYYGFPSVVGVFCLKSTVC